MPKLKNTAHMRRTSGKLLLKSKDNGSTVKDSLKLKERRQVLRRRGATDTAVRKADPTGVNAPGEGHNLRSVASRYLRYGRTHSGSSEAGDTASDAYKTEQHQKAQQSTDGGTPVHMGEVETRRDPKLVLGRRRLQRSTEKGHPEGNGGLSSVPPTKVPSTVMRGIGQRASRKTSSVVTTTQRAQQLISRARNRLQKERVQKEKVVRQAAKKLASSSGLSSSAAAVVTGPPGDGGGITTSDDTSVPPPSMELDEDEVGEASEVEEEGGGEEGGEEEGEQPKKVKIKLPDNKTPSKAQKAVPKYKRRRRCGECANCVVVDDCGECVFCLDKPKFGGPNIKKQACLQRRCLSLRIPTKPPPTPVKRKADTGTSGPAPKRGHLEEGPFLTVGQRGHLPAAPVIRKISQKQEKKAYLKLYWPDNLQEGCFPVYKSALSLDHPLCHTCGSAGLSPLATCLMCCSQFHWFCVDLPQEQSFFTCHNCWMCSVCGGKDKLVECCNCHKAFHRGCCLGAPKSGDSHVTSSKWRCTQCVKCATCGKTASTDDQPALWYDAFTCCADCNQLRNKGNFCPVCKEAYTDSDYESKMVQCAGCFHWVHAHCEDMTDEEYEILSELPEAEVTFYCRLCERPTMDAQWRRAVQAEVQAAFKLILMSLEKEEWFKSLLAKGTTPESGPSMKAVALGVEEEKYSSVTAFVRLCLQALESDGEENVTKKRKFTFMKIVYQYFPWFQLPPPPPPPEECQGRGSSTAEEITHVRLPDDLREHSYCLPGNTRPASQPATHPSPPVDQSQSSNRIHDDVRACVLCAGKGDSPDQDCGRLLSCGVGDWVHINCAYWSAEVFELNHDVYSGMLFDLHAAISRGRAVRCDNCHETGATVGCCSPKCQKSYHLKCARESHCLFLKMKQMFCLAHSGAVSEEDVRPSVAYGAHSSVIVDMNPDKAYKRVVTSLQPQRTSIRIGSMQVDAVGELCPLSDSKTRLIPNQYRCVRRFWDDTDPSKLGIYTLSVEAALDEDNDELEVELGTCDPRLDDPSLSFSTVTTADPTSSEEAGSSSLQDGEATSVAARSEQDMSGLTRILEQTAPANNNHVVRRSPVKTLLGEAMGKFRIPKKSKAAAASAQLMQATPPPSSGPASSVMLHKYLSGEDIHKEGLFYILTAPGGLSQRGPDPQELWDSVVCKVVSGRSRLGLPSLPSGSVSAVRLFGLQDAMVTRLVEQLPKAENCSQYNFKYFKPSKMSQWDRVKKKLLINPTGSARSEMYSGRKSPDMFGFLMSEHRPSPPEPDLEAVQLAIDEAPQVNPTFRPGNVQNLPIPMQYRIMLKNLKETLAVHKSRIHGLGLYARRPIEAGDMVVEYTGTVIRSCLTDKREKLYDRKGLGTYMFRIDEHDVVDATMSGNEARFINHSCDPNCYSRIITVDGKKKIMIFAMRRIVPGEEITYDYKFPLEDKKLPCQCGAPRCRRFLN